MPSSIQLVEELAADVPNATAPGRYRIFYDQTDNVLKLKDDVGTLFPIAGWSPWVHLTPLVFPVGSPYAASIQETVKVDPTTAIGTVTLPTAVGFAGFQIKVVSISDAILPFVVTIDTTSGQLINGVLTKTLTTAREFLIVESDNVGWLIVG
jgi:hypothetical protein